MRDKTKREILPVKSDVVFRLFFADERNTDDLVRFLKSVLRLPEEDYNDIEIADPNLLREYDGDKNSWLANCWSYRRKATHQK